MNFDKYAESCNNPTVEDSFITPREFSCVFVGSHLPPLLALGNY